MLKGIAASAGAAVAPLYHLEEPDLSVTRESGLDPAAQHQRYDQAAAQAIGELDALYEKARATDENVAQVFDIHRMMLEDPDLIDGIDALLDQGFNAEYAVRETADGLAAMFKAMEGDEYMQARAADVMDVGNRLIRVLKGIPDTAEFPDEPVIVAAVDLLPSQTVRLDKDKVAGFVTKLGSSTSHSVILARTLGIPCIVGMGEDYDKLPQSGLAAIDGSTGEVVPHPDEASQREFRRRREVFLADQAALEAYKDRKAVTKSGHRVLVCANIGGLDDIDAVIARGGGGVGLFRSEFVYLNSDSFPTEEAQFQIYKEVLARLAPRPVVVRTLDLGSDKQAPYFGIEGEENPAMGYRAIRICLKRPDIFRTQLRALLRASVYGKLNIMFPMITHVEQVLEIKTILAQVRQELDKEGVPYSQEVEYGIMIETPAAAVMADVLAKEVDFFSIGTNDLTQYTLAADRMNANISELFDSGHPAILRLIERTARAAHDAGIWVGICGESAANTALTAFYMSVGIDELSVSPASIPAVKRAVIECD
ncbi:MAG: phosphoenolpyruvate--protein phosphotransferase [Oscillospiraceae bacterium]|nr:phosphoenolpyruvate--protein phosphotransferase [Oscillospiraceae bacterium]